MSAWVGRLALIAAGSAVASPLAAQEVSGYLESDATWRYGAAQWLQAFPLAGPHSVVAGIGGTYLNYRYADDGGPARIESSGIAVAVGYRLETERISLTVQSAYEERQSTWRSAAGAAEGYGERGVTALGEMYIEASTNRLLTAVASHDAILRYSLARAGFLQRAAVSARGASLWLGADLTGQGDRADQARQAGAVAAVEFPSGAWVTLRAGYGQWRGDVAGPRATPYLSVSLFQAF